MTYNNKAISRLKFFNNSHPLQIISNKGSFRNFCSTELQWGSEASLLFYSRATHSSKYTYVIAYDNGDNRYSPRFCTFSRADLRCIQCHINNVTLDAPKISCQKCEKPRALVIGRLATHLGAAPDRGEVAHGVLGAHRLPRAGLARHDDGLEKIKQFKHFSRSAGRPMSSKTLVGLT